MREVHLRYLISQLSKIPAFGTAQVLTYDAGKWRCCSEGVTRIDPNLQIGLKALKSGKPYRKITKPSRALVRLAKGDLAVVFPVPPKTREATLEHHASRLEECFASATSSFHANHDELTGVLNRHGIKFELIRHYDEVFIQSNGGEKSDQQLNSSGDLVLFAFDIDRFKSVNDTYGHEAGDVVLAAFSARMNDIACELAEKYPAKFIFGRPGGEEFELIAIGTLSSNERTEIGELLLNRIRQPELPSYEELKTQLNKHSLSSMEPDASRFPSRVTASVGVSRRRVSRTSDNIEELHSALRKEADAALYRAKADGRNCLRIYEDIRRKHGRVFEYHSDSELVTIDIGSSVGVVHGDLYVAYYPPFTGTEKVQSGEKSGKILGDYPAVESGKLVVIDVQREVSTCAIVERISKNPVPVGTRLRCIFRGSKIPLLSRPSDQTALVEPLANLVPYIERVIENGSLSAVCSLDGSFAKDDTRSHKQKLDEVLVSLHLFLPVGTKIFYGIAGGLYAVIPRTGVSDPESQVDVFESVASAIERVGLKLYAGVCTLEGIPEGCDASPEAIIFYANAARLVRKDEKTNLIFFSWKTPSLLIHHWRRTNETENAIADYQQLRAYGFHSSFLDNQAGLTIMENDASDYFLFGEAAFISAYEADPDKPVFKGNLGLFFTQQGRFREAFKTFDSVKDYVLEARKGYVLAYAKSTLETFRSGVGIARAEVGDLLMEAASAFDKPPSSIHYRTWLRDIKEALKGGEFG